MFANRIDAGRQLADRLDAAARRGRGGAGSASRWRAGRGRGRAALQAPLDVIVVRKLGLPFQPELAMGALGENGVRVLDVSIVTESHRSPPRSCVRSRDASGHGWTHRVRRLRRGRDRGRPLRPDRRDRRRRHRHGVDGPGGLRGGPCVSEPGGSSSRHRWHLRRVAAVPRGGRGGVRCPTPVDFAAVGLHYRDFSPDPPTRKWWWLLDEAARRIARARGRRNADPGRRRASSGRRRRPERAPAPSGPGSPGVVVFAHGSGSSRHSPRNRYVAVRPQRRPASALC